MNTIVSIIVPVYNAEKYLAECIESVIQQDYDNWELILVDDGSKDNSQAICNSFADERIRYIYKENGGVCILLKKVDTERKVNDVPITHRKTAQVFCGSDTSSLRGRLWGRPHREDFAGRA